MMNSVASGGRLPSEYQEVEWIESHYTEYIDTGYIGNQDTRIVFDYQLTQYASSSHLARMFGDRASFISRGIMFNFTYNNTANIGIQYGNAVRNYGSPYTQDLDRHLIDYNNNQVTYIDDDIITSYSYVTFTTPSTIKLFAYTNEGAVNLGLRAKCYSVKFYEGSNLERDFVPCYRKADDVIGLYDLVYGTFYTNQGTGTFTKGQDV